jgi:thioredoxin-related protein
MSYPTSVLLEPDFKNPIPVPGYQTVETMEKILKYIATDTYKTVQFPEYEKTFVATWKEDPNLGPLRGKH